MENKKELKLLARVAKMKEPFKTMGHRMHQLIMEANPTLEASAMYGMPAYKHPDTGKIVCFFRNDKHFTFGLTEDAKLSGNGKIHACAWFLEELTEEVEAELKSILKVALQ